jgi:acyl-CoA synthetase (AMP-forming)/AMP-acid ligase II
MLAGDMLRRSAERFPAKCAIAGPTGRLSYAELDVAANRLAHALRVTGAASGAKVAMLSRNLTEYGVVFFGAARSGLVLVNVSIQYAVQELAYVLDKSDACTLIVDAQLLARAGEALAQCPKIKTVVCIGAHGSDGPAGTVDFDAFLAGHPDSAPDVVLGEDMPFCMTYTGGTTGRPKGVLCSHRARSLTAHTVVVEEALDERDVVAIVTPLFHVAALNIMFQPAVLVGATCVFVTPWSVAGFIDACGREQITAAFMVPTQANALVSAPEFDAARSTALASWRKLSFAGAPMPDWVQRTLLEKLPRLVLTQIYGQSEVGVLTALRHWHLPDKLGSIGRQAYNVDVRLFRTDGREAGVGEPGEIASRGDNLMLGYYGEPEQTQAVYRHGGGWLLTGDVGVRDADGFIRLIDRAKDMLISGGENIYPKEIEDVIYSLDAVAECAVFGIPDPKWGEVPAAYVMLKPGASLEADHVIERCRRDLAEFKRPRLVRIVDQFPKTPIGKIQKNLLREPYWAGLQRKI